MRFSLFCLVALGTIAGCRRSSQATGVGAVASSAPSSPSRVVAASPTGFAVCGNLPPLLELAPGLVLQRVRVRQPVLHGDGCVTIARVNPAHFQFRLLTAAADGGSRRADEWANTFKLTGVMNASMFQANERSASLMVSGAVVNNPDDNEKYGAFMAFDPKVDDIPPVSFFGRPCNGFKLSSARKQYKTIVQNYRLLDCDGGPIAWKDEKIYSVAAIGQDRRGWVTFIHSRTPFSMTEFAKILAEPSLDMRAAMFVEGGPEASLYIRTGAHDIRAIGSYETGFSENDDNARFWRLPNMIGFSPR